MKRQRNMSLSVSIGITCLNEEKNIVNLLNSVFTQNEKAFFIKEIIAISDGSTDKTVERIKGINDSRIKIVIGLKRLGKPERLNQIFSMAKGEIVILLDADITLANSETLNNLVKPFFSTHNVGLTSGIAKPVDGKTFVEKSVNSSVRAYHALVDKINNGDNIFACEGRILAISRKLSKIEQLPRETIATDAYLYFLCITNAFVFKYAKSAEVRYFSPKYLKEQIAQNKRFEARRYILKKYFGNIVNRELKIPWFLYIKTMLSQFIKDPIYSTSIFLINTYTKYLAMKESKKINALWEIAFSTKKEIKTKKYL